MRVLGMWALLAAAAVYAALCLFLYGNQRKMLYHPTAAVAAEGATSFQLAAAGESLKIWRFGDGADALLYFGGNAEDVAWNISAFRARFPDHTVYLANYRGYGGSTGAPTEAGLLHDALALYDIVRPRHRNLSLIGRSLGSAVAAHVAARREVQKLALVTPFDSVLNLAKKMFPVFPVALLLKDHYNTAARAPDITAPVLVVIAGNDKVIPRNRTDALIKTFPASQVTVTLINEANHSNIDTADGYMEALVAFFDK